MSIFSKKTQMVLALLFCTGAASAEEIRPGCYERVYSDAHLAGQPAQVVSEIRFYVGEWLTEVARRGALEVIAANQGHARRDDNAGRVMTQFLFCGSETDETVCQVECDGGSLFVTRQTGDSLTFRTRYLLVGNSEECGGQMDLAEVPGQWVSYRLNRVSTSVCEGM
ncbi:hypothetical protein [Pacificoceanicola onchidii]|uniref:hypothetical protein n=1 Tax=Pacificoceanicola onchidii TaxID=2562685 RepID=UPI0010A6A62B|nr:hypothetical protein [Pacificoceanicola onchidii]